MTKKTGTYQKANRLLAASALGLLAAYPFQQTFLGGLIVSGSTAALVGGLADWFAVNALFRRPLGIRPNRILRTDIIPRNREKIYDALADMVEHELLSPEALRHKLGGHDFYATLLKHWEEADQDKYREYLTSLLGSVLAQLEGQAKILEQEVDHLLSDEKILRQVLYPLLAQALDFLTDTPEGKKALREFLRPIGAWLGSPELKDWLIRWMENSKIRYADGQTTRKLVLMALPDSTELAGKLQDYLEEQLHYGTAQETILHWLREKSFEIKRLAENRGDFSSQYPLLQATLDSMLRAVGRQALAALREQTFEPETARRLGSLLSAELERRWVGLAGNLESRKHFNARMQSLLCEAVDKQHEWIGKTVREGLARYSDERLVELIESKTGTDLQMIRINGSVVGGLAGMLIYILQL